MTSNTTRFETRRAGSRWAVVLAAGNGSRLGELTRDSAGVQVPKQFCSLDETGSLLRLTLRRAGRLVPRTRTVSIVAAEHRRWWVEELAGLPPRNVVVQPANRGTAAGVLLPLLEILARDRDATVVVLPSDHFVEDESMFEIAVRRSFAACENEPGRVVLLGVAPDEADPELGWIEPEPGGGWLTRVRRFVEKPERAVAEALMARGALWNTFVLVARAGTIVEMARRHLPGLVRDLEAARQADSLDALYARLVARDFSRDILQRGGGPLRVMRVPACGWTDLGTPERIARGAFRLDPPRRPPRQPDAEGALAGLQAAV